MNPECRAGKHANCDSHGWRDDLGHIGPCLCGCHDTTPAPHPDAEPAGYAERQGLIGRNAAMTEALRDPTT